MTEEDKSYTSVLLPEAKVTLFTNDEETKTAYLALQEDWRYARVSLNVTEGDVKTAALLYKENKSPELVIIQTDEIDQKFTDGLEELAGYCAEGTSAIVVGPVNDVNLYRKLVGMGVSDYLVKPLKTDVLGDDIAATLLEKIGASDSRLVAVIGAKGGVGTTAISEMLTWGVSDLLKKKAFLLDAASGWSTLSVGMDFEPTTTLAECVRAAVEQNDDSFSRMLHHINDRLTVLSSGGDVMLDDLIDPDGYEALLEMIMTTYPFVICDLSASTPNLKNTILKRAQHILFVTSPGLSSIRAGRTLLQEIKDLRGGEDEDVNIIVNMHGIAPKAEVPKAQIKEGLESEDILYIPFAPELFYGMESEAAKPTEDKDATRIVRAILSTMKGVLGVSVKEQDDSDPKSAGLGKFLNKFSAKS